MSELPKLSVILTTYKDGALLDDCLDSLVGQYDDIEIIIKNQESETSEETFKHITQKYPYVKIINGPNTGLSKGSNEGAKTSSGKYLLFLGADIRFTSLVLKDLVQYMEDNSDVGAATAELHIADGSIDMDAHRAFPSPWISFTRLFGLQKIFPMSGLFNRYFLPDRDMTKPHEIELGITHFMICPRKVYDELGGFDEDFFLYGEDVDYFYRIHEAGYKTMYLPQFKVTHLKGGSVGIRKTTRNMVRRPLEHRMKMQKLSTESMKLFVKKHYSKKYPRVLNLLMILAADILGKARVLNEWRKKS